MSGADAAAPARVILLRHAVTTDAEVCQGARYDLPLSDVGHRQARAAVAHVLGVALERTFALRPTYATSTWLTRTDAARDGSRTGGVWQLDRFGW